MPSTFDIYFTRVCLRVGAHMCHNARVDARGQLVESALSFRCVAPRDGTKAW